MKLINAHHFGGSDKAPPNSVLIDRTTAYGNPYSSKSGRYTKEECVALHRVSLYRDLVKTPSYLDKLMIELNDKDLVCWCTHDTYLKACHGDNYRHILDPRFRSRTYDQSVLFYLMEDLRSVMKQISRKVMNDIPQDSWIRLYCTHHDAKLELEELIATIKKRKSYFDVVCEIVAFVVIDLEYAAREVDPKMIEYRIDHMAWQCHRWMDMRGDRDHEPQSPHITLKRRKKSR